MKIAMDILNEKEQRQLWSVSSKATVFEALTVMAEKEIGALIVMDDKNQVVGIVSERDYARKIVLLGKTSRNTTVGQIMTPAEKMFSIRPETPIDDCMILITAKKIRHLPIFAGKHLVGLISAGDVLISKISEQELRLEQLSNYIEGRYF